MLPPTVLVTRILILAAATSVTQAPAVARQGSPGARTPAVLPPIDVDRKEAPRVLVKTAEPAGAPDRSPAPGTPIGQPKVEEPRPAPGPIPPGTVTFAEGPDGVCWAVGDNYKARFDRTGVTFVPFFGAGAARSWPLTLRLAEVACGAMVPLATAAPVRTGQRITIERGAVTEQYDVDAGGIEQRFVVTAAPRGGDLVLRLEVETELTPGRDAHGLRFTGEPGHVGYTSAIAFDAADQPVGVATDLVDGHIVLRVPAESVARAQGAVTIDPRIATFLVHAPLPPHDLWLRPDIAHGEVTRASAIVYERAYSVADHDVYSQLCDSQGAIIPNTGVWIDVSGEYWSKPRVAYQAASQQFLVVAEHGPNGNALPHDIRARARTDAGTAVGPELVISGGEQGSKVEPVVGGDSNPFAPSYWCVVWQRNYSATDYDIHYAMVGADGTLNGGVRVIDNSSATVHYQPAISRTNGSHYESLQRWNIVFLNQLAVGDIDVWFARVNRDGTILVQSRFLDTNQTPDYNAVATTATEGDLWLACYERLLPSGDTDIVAKIMGGTGFGSGAIDLSILENFAPGRKQRRPRADSDGTRFAVAYEELYPVGVNDWDVHVSTFHVMPASAGFQLGVSEAHAVLANTTDVEYDVQIASAWGANWSIGPSRLPVGRTSYLATWAHGSAIEGAVYQGRGGFGAWSSVPTGCGLGLGAYGVPSIGGFIELLLAGASGPQLIVMGAPLVTPIPVCTGCSIGFDLAVSVAFPGHQLRLVIPGDPGLLGARFAFQGIEFAAGGCPEGFRLSDTQIATID